MIETRRAVGLIYDGRIRLLACGCAVWQPEFDAIGDALAAAVGALPVERLMELDASLRGSHSGALVYKIGVASPPLLTMAGMVAKASPWDFARWAEELPADTVLAIAPEISLTPPDALLYAACDGTDDDLVHAQALAYDLIDRGHHCLGDVDGMRLPERFYAARASIEDEMLRMAAASPEWWPSVSGAAPSL